MKKILFNGLSIVILFAVATSSCKKDETNVESSVPLSYSKEDIQIDGYFDEIDGEVDELTMVSESMADGSDSVVYVGSQGKRIRYTYRYTNYRVDSVVFNNFVNGKSKFKRAKNGVIVIKRIGGPLQDTFVRIITFKTFSINGNIIEGTRKITKVNTYTYNIKLENGKITFKDGTTYTRSYTRTRTWTAGFDTPFNIWDDVYSIEGQAQGINRREMNYTHTIVSPIIISTSCPYVLAGEVEILVGDYNILINYGDSTSSTCDANVVITVNGEKNTIQLNVNE